MEENPNKAVVRRFFDEVFNGQEEAAAFEVIAAGFVAHHPSFPDGIRGPEGILGTVGFFRAGFPDLHYHVEALVAEADLVAVRWSARGTHQNAFMGAPPTGRAIAITGMDLFRVADGQCVEAWVNSDFLGLLQQIGALP